MGTVVDRGDSSYDLEYRALPGEWLLHVEINGRAVPPTPCVVINAADPAEEVERLRKQAELEAELEAERLRKQAEREAEVEAELQRQAEERARAEQEARRQLEEELIRQARREDEKEHKMALQVGSR